MKTFLATLAGILTAVLIMFLLESLGHILLPLPTHLAADLNELIKHPELIPVPILISVIVSHVLGMLAGLIVASYIDKQTLYPLFLIGGFLFIGSVATVLALPHPVWFAICDIGGMFLVGTLVLYKTHTKRARK